MIYILKGQAEAIAGEIHEAAVFQNYDVKLHCLKDEGKEFQLKNVKCAVFVCSTTGALLQLTINYCLSCYLLV